MTSAKLNSAMPKRIDVAQASQPAGLPGIPARHSEAPPTCGEHGCSPNPQAGKPALRAFSLIEVLIAVTLMSVIVIGLMAVFGETQRAFRTGITQVDVMEGGRSALEIMAREVEQATPTRQRGAANFAVAQNGFIGAPLLGYSPATLQPYSLNQALPGGTLQRQNILQDFIFMTREGQEWKAIGYAVVYTNYIGSLYRYETNYSAVSDGWPAAAYQAYNTFFSANPVASSPSRVLDNVVNLRVHTYDHLGRLISPNYNYLTNYPNIPTLNLDQVQTAWGPRYDDVLVRFFSNALPAYVEIELGILEGKTADRARIFTADIQTQQALDNQRDFLGKQAGKVQIFRQRIPIRNVDPSVYQ
jgi:type II secretory pathway component PulJ